MPDATLLLPDDPALLTTPHDAGRRRWLVRVGAGALTALGGCAGFGVPDHYDISPDRILSALSDYFPLRRRVLEAFELSVTMPRLRMLPLENRLQTDFDLGLTENLLTRRTFRGVMGLASGVRYEPIDHSVRLTRVRLDRFAMADLPGMLTQPLQMAGSSVLEPLLENLSVYRLPDRLVRQIDAAGLAPRELKVNPDGLSIAFDRRAG